MKNWIFVLLFLGVAIQVEAQSLTKDDFLFNQKISLVSQQNQPVNLKNKNIATAISVGATISSYFLYGAMINAGNGGMVFPIAALFVLVTAPSTGYLYSYNNDDFWRNTLHRTIALGIAVTGAFIIVVSVFDDLFAENADSNPGAVTIGSLFMIGGMSWFYISTFRDFIVVRKKVDEYNQNLLTRVQITPILDPVNKTAGVGFRVNF